MTQEFKQIISTYLRAKEANVKAVLATVVHLEGSSYRRPGVRMLLLSNQQMIGAVSGGCVEKEIQRQSVAVFKTGVSKLMSYDGRYRLGCEGTLYILLEAFEPEEAMITAFFETMQARNPFSINSYYNLTPSSNSLFGSNIILKGQEWSFTNKTPKSLRSSRKDLSCFQQELAPCFKLLIIGAEHDAVNLCQFAANTGWEVTVVSTITDPKNLSNFPGASIVLNIEATQLDTTYIDAETAVVLMTHNFAKDLSYLTHLVNSSACYIGLLGPAKRREKMLQAIIENNLDCEEEFISSIHGPAGLNLGAETPQEIAISILSEILSLTRNQIPMSLEDKKGGIHDHTNLTSVETIKRKV
jgi:xanthine/CO dehydrogenase XdhC/CoxF family maturation factor